MNDVEELIEELGIIVLEDKGSLGFIGLPY